MNKFLLIFKDKINQHALIALQQEDFVISNVRYSAGTYHVSVASDKSITTFTIFAGQYNIELEPINDDRFAAYKAVYKFIEKE